MPQLGRRHWRRQLLLCITETLTTVTYQYLEYKKRYSYSHDLLIWTNDLEFAVS